MSGGRQPGGTGPQADDSRGRPYWLVGIVILGVLVVVLGGGLALDRTLRPRVGIEPLTGSGIQPETPGRPSEATQPGEVVGALTRTPVLEDGNRSPERAVEEAYLRYWDVYTGALLNLDVSRLAEVVAEDELRRIQAEIAGFRQAGHALRVRVTHNYLIFDVTADEAKILDEIVDRSFRVDPVTKDPPQGSDESTTVRDLFLLKKAGGAWRVTKSIRESG